MTLYGVYQKYNRLYFEGKLPRRIYLHYGNVPFTHHAETTWWSDGTIEIEISRRFNRCGRLTCIMLLHEMVHASLPSNAYHGPRFSRRLAKLIKQGAYNDLL